jgi:hypothetical protein
MVVAAMRRPVVVMAAKRVIAVDYSAAASPPRCGQMSRTTTSLIAAPKRDAAPRIAG